MKNIIKIIGLALSLTAGAAYAVPTLYFDGALGYDAGTGELSITNASLINSIDITPSPDLTSSSLTFGGVFNAAYDIGTGVAGLFDGIAGDDLSISDSSGSLLTGEFNYLYMVGNYGSDKGTLSGELSATGGSLASFFSTSDLIALEFNLTTTFAMDMFDTSFTGNVNGKLEGPQSVPEPSILALLGVGLLLIGTLKTSRKV